MKITIYELLKRVAKGKAPKKIKVTGRIYEFDEELGFYITIDVCDGFKTCLGGVTGEINLIVNAFNDIVEILSEENDEWEDIEEIDTYHQGNECLFIDKYYGNITGNLVDEVIADKINSLIKNQKYLKEKLDNKDD